MLFLRAVLLELLVCVHVVGAAVLFRRLFPRESPWLGYFVPTLLVMAVGNFVEHFLPLTQLGWLLPFTVLGLTWTMITARGLWHDLLLPTTLFILTFTWVFFVRCLHPEITCNTEGTADMARMLDFCMGGTVPPVDTWCPPLDHGGYYTFQYYGASLLKRLFLLDIGTGYNVAYSLLNTMTFLAGAAAAHVLAGRRTWVAVATLLVLLANFTGAAGFLLVWNSLQSTPGVDVFDTRQAVDIYDGWGDPDRHNPFTWLYPGKPPALRLFTPAFNTYFAEFHPNLGGHFMTLMTMLVAQEAFRLERSNLPWIALLVLPFFTVITATWFIFVVTVFGLGAFIVALAAGRRPESWQVVLGAAALVVALLFPSVQTLLVSSFPVPMYWTPWAEHTPLKEFCIQWWPVIIPWCCLWWAWPKMNALARWIHLAIPLLLIFIEVVTFDYRVPMVEKMWGAVYGASLVSLLPQIFLLRGVVFRGLTVGYMVLAITFLMAWVSLVVRDVDWRGVAFHLQGDTPLTLNPQKHRILQTLQSLHHVTILPGRSTWSYNEAPSEAGFSENRCYIAWFAKGDEAGHVGEADFRDRQNNAFYDGKLPDPAGFLRANDIAAILIYPDDNIPDEALAKFKEQLTGTYYYVDCRGDGPQNAGVFMRGLR